MFQIEKLIENKSGNILIRKSDDCGIVEILHLWDNNKSGCVIGCWEKRKSDGKDIAEFKSINDRIINTEYDNDEMLLNILRFGQKLSDLILESSEINKE